MPGHCCSHKGYSCDSDSLMEEQWQVQGIFVWGGNSSDKRYLTGLLNTLMSLLTGRRHLGVVSFCFSE